MSSEMPDIAVSFSNLGKRYWVSHEREPYGRLSESVVRVVRGAAARARDRSAGTTEMFWALRDVTFDVERGEVLGIVGRNGQARPPY